MSKPIFLADLDGFLFDLQHKCANPVQLAATNLGREPSYMSETQLKLWQWLSTATRVVPVTGRNTESFGSVQLKFEEPAIVSFGGIILMPDGNPEPRWLEIIQAEAAQFAEAIKQLKERVNETAQRLSLNLKGEIISDLGIDQYVKVMPVQGKALPAQCAVMAGALAVELSVGWQMHHNGNQVCLLPPYLRKQRAVQYYLDNLAGEYGLVLGGGDSLSDLEFIQLADFALFPKRSQVFESLSAE